MSEPSKNGSEPAPEAVLAMQQEWADPHRYDVGSAADKMLGPRVALQVDINSLIRIQGGTLAQQRVQLMLSPHAAKMLGLDLIAEAERAHVDYILMSYMHTLDDEASAVRPSPKGLMLDILEEYRKYRAQFELQVALHGKEGREGQNVEPQE